MPVIKKQQVLSKIESTEGVSATPGSADAVQVFEPALSDDVENDDRTPAGPSLSTDFSVVGRKTRTLTMRSDMRGSGDTSLPVTAPDWGNFVRSCGYHQVQPVALTVPIPSGGTGWQLGELVTQSSGSIIGVIVGIFTAGNAFARQLAAAGTVVVAPVVGTFTAAATVGSSSSTAATASAAADYAGITWRPTSNKLIQLVSTNSWSSGVPTIGEILTVRRSGVVVGAAQLVKTADAVNMDDIEVTMVHGEVANGDTLVNPAGTSSIVLTSVPVMTETPSITHSHNLDGKRRELLGSRGDFTVGAEVGQPAQFEWTFTGDLGPTVFEPPVVTSGLSTIRAPRFIGSVAAYGLGADLIPIATKSWSLAQGNQTPPNLDGNRAGGSTGSNVVDRQPAFTFTVDQTHSLFDWEAARDAATAIRVAIAMGQTKGNIITICAPNSQVTEVSDSDSDGIATHDVTIRPRRIRESGDDEIWFTQL